MMIRSATPRAGLTLLEVIVSMAIFLLSMVAIHQLVSIGTDRAVDVKWQSRTSLRCQSKLNEIIVGAELLTGGGGFVPFSDDPDLQWKMEANPFDTAGLLYTVKVTVQVDPSKTTRTIDSQLCQMILNPANRGSTMDLPIPTPAGTPTTDSPTPSSSSTTPAAGAAAAPAAAGKTKTAAGAAGGMGGGGGKTGAGANTGAGNKAGGGGGIATPGAGGAKTGNATTPGVTTTPTLPSAITLPAGGGNNRGGGGGGAGGGGGGGKGG